MIEQFIMLFLIESVRWLALLFIVAIVLVGLYAGSRER
jgi:hypothetical protein